MKDSHNIIIGLHSIGEALKNSKRALFKIVATEEGINDLRKATGVDLKEYKAKIQLVSSHKLQEEAKKYYNECDFKYSRVPSQVFAIFTKLDFLGPAFLYDLVEKSENLRIVCLDQVTDAHNGAAILRTAAFYGADALVVATKGNFGQSPSFMRIASGAVEHVPMVVCSSLPKLMTKLKEKGVQFIGFSEHAEGDVIEGLDDIKKRCLVMGAEDVGMSNAVSRVVDYKVALKPVGAIKSLNVSVATAVAMEKFF